MNNYTRNTNDTKATLIFVGVVIFLFATLIGNHVFQSYMEAAVYNRVTGSNLTTWDAMWIELRVEGRPLDLGHE